MTATTQRKRAEWERMLKTELIPVTHPHPALTPAGNLAYTLDRSRLNWMQVTILARKLARRDDLTEAHARALIDAGLPIPASEVAIVQEIEQDVMEHPAFRLWWARPLTKTPFYATMFQNETLVVGSS